MQYALWVNVDCHLLPALYNYYMFIGPEQYAFLLFGIRLPQKTKQKYENLKKYDYLMINLQKVLTFFSFLFFILRIVLYFSNLTISKYHLYSIKPNI